MEGRNVTIRLFLTLTHRLESLKFITQHIGNLTTGETKRAEIDLVSGWEAGVQSA